MYNNLLQAELGITRIDIVQSPNSTQMVLPIQRDDLGVVNRAFENALVNDGTYTHQLPLLLRPLAGDKLLFDYTTTELQNYPILTTNNPSATDVSPGISDKLNNLCDRYQTLYASNYTMMIAPDPISAGAPTIIAALTPSINAPVNALTSAGNAISSTLTKTTSAIAGVESTVISEVSKVLTPASEIVFALGSIVATLTALKAIFFATSMTNIISSLSFILPRLAVELVMNMLHVDRFMQLATTEVAVINSKLQNAIDATSQLYSTLLGIGLTPILLKHQLDTIASLTKQQSISKQPMPNLNETGIPSELLQVGSIINWAGNETQRYAQDIELNCQKILDSRLNSSGDMTEIMSSLKSVEALIAMAQCILNVQGSMASVPTTAVGITSSLQAFGQVMNEMNTPAGASYTVVGNQLVITPPNIPAPSSNVANVLTSGGATVGNTKYTASSA
jgi:hypothetical protein